MYSGGNNIDGLVCVDRENSGFCKLFCEVGADNLHAIHADDCINLRINGVVHGKKRCDVVRFAAAGLHGCDIEETVDMGV